MLQIQGQMNRARLFAVIHPFPVANQGALSHLAGFNGFVVCVGHLKVAVNHHKICAAPHPFTHFGALFLAVIAHDVFLRGVDFRISDLAERIHPVEFLGLRVPHKAIVNHSPIAVLSA